MFDFNFGFTAGSGVREREGGWGVGRKKRERERENASAFVCFIWLLFVYTQKIVSQCSYLLLGAGGRGGGGLCNTGTLRTATRSPLSCIHCLDCTHASLVVPAGTKSRRTTLLRC